MVIEAGSMFHIGQIIKIKEHVNDESGKYKLTVGSLGRVKEIKPDKKQCVVDMKYYTKPADIWNLFFYSIEPCYTACTSVSGYNSTGHHYRHNYHYDNTDPYTPKATGRVKKWRHNKYETEVL